MGGGAVHVPAGRKFRITNHSNPSNTEEMVVTVEKFLKELCQVTRAFVCKFSREKPSEIKFLKHHSVGDVAHSGPGNFTVMVWSACTWFQYLSITGRRYSKGL